MAEFVHNGIRYREIGNGEVEVLGPADTSQRVLTRPRSDTSRRKEGGEADQSVASGVLETARVPYAGQIAANEAARGGADAAKAAADARKAQVEAEKVTAEAQIEAGQRDIREKSMSSAQDATIASLVATINAAREARELSKNGWFATGFGAGTMRDRGGSAAADVKALLDTIGGNTAFDRLQRMRDASPTGGALGGVSAPELDMLKSSIASLDQTQSDEAFQRRMDAIIETYGKTLEKFSPADAERLQVGSYAGATPASQPQAQAPAQGAPQTELRSDGSWAADPALAGLNSRINQMIREGKSEGEIRAYMDSVRPGLGAQANYLKENIEYRRNNPSFNPSVDVENVWTPSTGVNAFLGSIADNPIGSAAISAANAVTAGNLGNIAGGDADLVLQAIEEKRPISSFVGDVAGTMAPISLLGKVGALGRFGGLGADALYGGIRGASESDDNTMMGALTGTGAALGGNAAGRFVGGAVGGALRGAGSDQVQLLADRGVRMTPGQILGDSGIIGRGVRGMEDAAASIPFLGAAVNNRRRLGLEDYNRAQVAENLAPLGFTPSPNAAGPTLMAEANQAVDDAFGVLNGRSIAGDQQYINDVGAALSRAQGIAGAGDQVSTMSHQVIAPLFDNGVISGPNLRSGISDLREARTKMARGNSMEALAGKEVGALENALLDLAARQAPDVADDIVIANEAYKSLAPLREASMLGVNEGGLFTPAQVGRKSVQGTRRYGGAAAASEGRYGGYDLQQAAQDVLPSTIPNSGTADRAIANAILPASVAGGAGLGATLLDPATATIAAALGSAYSPVGQDLLQAALTQRPQVARDIGKYVLDWRDLLGHAGAAAATAGVY